MQRIGIFVCLLAALSYCFAWNWPKIDTCDDKKIWGLDSDGVQFEKKAEIMEGDYREWWFFTVLDEKTNFAMTFSYGFGDPLNLRKTANANIATQVWENYTQYETAGTVTKNDFYKFSAFEGSKDNASLVIGENFIDVLDDTTYRAVGKTLDGAVSWDFIFSQAVTPMREDIAIKFIAQCSWESYMPTAQVTGEAVVNGKVHPVVKGVGYHDHNFGDWPNGMFNWVWSNYGSPEEKFAFVLGGYKVPVIDKYTGYIFFRFGHIQQKIGAFCGDEFDFRAVEFGYDSKGHKYSTHNHAVAHNSDWKIVIDSKPVANNLNPSGAGMGIVVFEQIAHHEIDLYRMEDGEWTLLKSFSGLGLDEWSDLEH